jgi:hypothetical protein
VKSTHIIDCQTRDCLLAADRRVAVGMVAVQKLHKGSIGHRAGRIAKLRQPMESELTHPSEVGLGEGRTSDHIGQEPQRPVSEATEGRDTEHRGVGSDVGVELRPDSRERLVHLDRRPAVAAFVEHVGRQRREALLPGGIGRRAPSNEQDERDHGHVRMANGPQIQAVR